MKVQIRKFSPIQTAKIFGLMYLIVGMLIFLPMALIAVATKKEGDFGPLFLVLAPFLYGLVGFIGIAVACAFYNFLTPYIGGIEFES